MFSRVKSLDPLAMRIATAKENRSLSVCSEGRKKTVSILKQIEGVTVESANQELRKGKACIKGS